MCRGFETISLEPQVGRYCLQATASTRLPHIASKSTNIVNMLRYGKPSNVQNSDLKNRPAIRVIGMTIIDLRLAGVLVIGFCPGSIGALRYQTLKASPAKARCGLNGSRQLRDEEINYLDRLFLKYDICRRRR